MSPQPKSRLANRLPEVEDVATARERILASERRLKQIEDDSLEASPQAQSATNLTRIERKINDLRYDLDRHEHTAAEVEGAGEQYLGLFKVYKYSATSVYVNSGYVSLAYSTEYITGGEVSIGVGAGIHVIVLNIWYNGAWKWSITDDSTWPDARSTITDGGNFECFKTVIGVCTVADSVIVDESVIQIIHGEALNLVDWSRPKPFFRVAKVASNTVEVLSGVVISGTDVNQVSNTTKSISSTNGTYYLYANIYYDLGAWECDIVVSSVGTYPTQAVDELNVLLAMVIVSSGVIYAVYNCHGGGEILNPRVAE